MDQSVDLYFSSFVCNCVVHCCQLIMVFLNFSAKDCRQKRPGEVFNKVKSKADPKVIDAEYEAFLNDMDGKAGGRRPIKMTYSAPAGTRK